MGNKELSVEDWVKKHPDLSFESLNIYSILNFNRDIENNFFMY